MVSLIILAVLWSAPGRQSQAAAPVAWPTSPPVPAVRPVKDTYFGQTVVDPYRYFENMSDPTVAAYFRDQNAYTRAVLARLDGPRQKLLARIKQLDNAGAAVSAVTRVGQQYFYLKRPPGVNSDMLCVANADGSGERILVDPNKLSTPGNHITINYFLPSLDGKYVAYGISAGGSEAAVIHVVDTTTTTVLPDAIDRAYFVGATSWLPDGKSFYYVRFPKLAPGESPLDKETRAVAYLHVLGNDPDKDAPVFGYGVNPAVPFGLTDFPIVTYSPAAPNYTIAYIAHGVQNEIDVFAAPQPKLSSGQVAWQHIVTTADDVTGFDVKGNTIYLLSHKDAPQFKVIATSIDHPDLANAQVVVAPGSNVVEQVSVAQDGLYVRSRNGGFGQLVRFTLAPDGAATNPMPVKLPYQGDVFSLTTDSQVPGATFGLTGWTHSALYYAVAADGTVTDTHLKPPSPIDESAYTSEEVMAPSQDGTMIPLSLVYKKGLPLDGSHPVLLDGYGAYGITIEPSFSNTRVAWMERGGVYAVCHVRGGGWFGEAWHNAGMIGTKPHTWQDFIGCAQWLIAHRYTSAAHLAGEGTSAGGILIGRAITTRPDLFAAAIDEVGATNALRLEFTPNGPPNIPEFGTEKTETGFKALYAMDAYQHVVNGTKYPAVLLVTGINDPRVAPWMVAKFAARLQAATAGGRPVLLRVDYGMGHGFLASSRNQAEQLLTDEYSFLLWQCGDPEFAAYPKRIAR
jgi:prolyl oligopeptidase